MEKTYYEKFGIKENASFEEIKRAYRRLALFYHPDKNGGALKYESMFKEINKIYQVLSDPKSRARYDADLLRHRENPPGRYYYPGGEYGPARKKEWSSKQSWAMVIIFLFIKQIFFSSSSTERSESDNSVLSDYVTSGSYLSNPHQFVQTDTTTLLNYLKQNSDLSKPCEKR